MHCGHVHVMWSVRASIATCILAVEVMWRETKGSQLQPLRWPGARRPKPLWATKARLEDALPVHALETATATTTKTTPSR